MNDATPRGKDRHAQGAVIKICVPPSRARWAAVCVRLEQLVRKPPPGVARLFGWGLLPSGALRLEIENIPGLTLAAAVFPARVFRTSLGQEQFAACNRLRSLLDQWRRSDFVHGDLSLRNLILTPRQSIVAIDWLMDLGSPSGTPRYAHPDSAQGRHDFATDRYSMERVIEGVYGIK